MQSRCLPAVGGVVLTPMIALYQTQAGGYALHAVFMGHAPRLISAFWPDGARADLWLTPSMDRTEALQQVPFVLYHDFPNATIIWRVHVPPSMDPDGFPQVLLLRDERESTVLLANPAVVPHQGELRDALRRLGLEGPRLEETTSDLFVSVRQRERIVSEERVKGTPGPVGIQHLPDEVLQYIFRLAERAGPRREKFAGKTIDLPRVPTAIERVNARWRNVYASLLGPEGVRAENELRREVGKVLLAKLEEINDLGGDFSNFAELAADFREEAFSVMFIAGQISQQFPPDESVYVSIGSSPVLITLYMERKLRAEGHQPAVVYLPLSGGSDEWTEYWERRSRRKGPTGSKDSTGIRYAKLKANPEWGSQLENLVRYFDVIAEGGAPFRGRKNVVLIDFVLFGRGTALAAQIVKEAMTRWRLSAASSLALFAINDAPPEIYPSQIKALASAGIHCIYAPYSPKPHAPRVRTSAAVSHSDFIPPHLSAIGWIREQDWKDRGVEIGKVRAETVATSPDPVAAAQAALRQMLGQGRFIYLSTLVDLLLNATADYRMVRPP